MTGSNTIAVIVNREGFDCQALFSSVVADWRRAGVRVAGVLAENNDVEGACSAGFLRDIASGRRYSIQLDAPPPGKTCHLDAMGMDAAGAGLLGQIALADVVVFSKFGKLEAMRQGLWPALTAVIAAGKPLLTSVSLRHLKAWNAFVPATAWREPNALSIQQWWQAVTTPTHHRGETGTAQRASSGGA